MDSHFGLLCWVNVFRRVASVTYKAQLCSALFLSFQRRVVEFSFVLEFPEKQEGSWHLSGSKTLLLSYKYLVTNTNARNFFFFFFIPFPRVLVRKRLEFELAYYDVPYQYINHYITETKPHHPGQWIRTT